MTKYKCSSCEYISDLKLNVTRHIASIKSCGTGEKKIIEIVSEIVCEYCDKKFTSRPNLTKHLKNSCKKMNDMKNDMEEEIRILKLKLELSEAKNEKVSVNINNNNTINNTNNNTTNNNNIQNTCIINNYIDTSLDKITDAMYNDILKNVDEGYMIIAALIEIVHFNANIPENHNIYISNKSNSNKFVCIRKNGVWGLANKKAEIDNLIHDKETNFSDWLAAKGGQNKKSQKVFNDYKNTKRTDEDIPKLIREDVELLLYNNRNLINKKN